MHLQLAPLCWILTRFTGSWSNYTTVSILEKKKKKGFRLWILHWKLKFQNIQDKESWDRVNAWDGYVIQSKWFFKWNMKIHQVISFVHIQVLCWSTKSPSIGRQPSGNGGSNEEQIVIMWKAISCPCFMVHEEVKIRIPS